MSDERPDPQSTGPEQTPPASPAPGGDARGGYTPGGYVYEVVGAPAVAEVAAEPIAPPAPPVDSAALAHGPRRVPLWMLPVAVVIVAALAGVAVWFIAGALSDESDESERVNANVGSVINAFSQGQASGTLRRFEGALPPGYPQDIPTYNGAEVVSSIVQLNEDDALFLVVYDTPDTRDDVTAHFVEALDSGDLQLDGVQDNRDSTLIQFSRTDDADVSGVVLITESEEQSISTIFYSIEVISGADSVDLDPFEPRVSRSLPEEYPEVIPEYPDAVVIETVFQKDARNDIFGVAFITRDSSQSVLDFYRDEMDGLGWTVSDVDASQSPLEDAEGINFEDEAGELTGSVIVGVFGDDRNYTRVELQVSATR